MWQADRSLRQPSRIQIVLHVLQPRCLRFYEQQPAFQRKIEGLIVWIQFPERLRNTLAPHGPQLRQDRCGDCLHTIDFCPKSLPVREGNWQES